MNQLSLFGDATVQPAPLQQPQPAAPWEGAAKPPPTGRLTASRFANVAYEVTCPLLARSVEHCHHCTLFRAGIVTDLDGSMFEIEIDCNAPQYLDPSTGSLAAEYTLLVAPAYDGQPAWINNVHYSA